MNLLTKNNENTELLFHNKSKCDKLEEKISSLINDLNCETRLRKNNEIKFENEFSDLRNNMNASLENANNQIN